MKKIGLLCNLRDSTRFSFNVAYYKFASTLGQVNLIEPRSTQIIDDLDLLILPGGEDVYPLRYGEAPEEYTSQPNLDFEFFDSVILPEYFNKNTPIFGICRGLQTINVAFGGTLHQHVYEPTSQSCRWEHAHDAIEEKTGKKFGINSLHHQAINALAENFKVLLTGKTKSKKVEQEKTLQIEAIKHETAPILAVQFHPEEMFDDPMSKDVTEWIYKELNSLYEIK